MGPCLRQITIIVGLLAANLHLSASVSAPKGRVNLSPQEREWIVDHPVLRVGALTDWAPFSYTNADGAMSGIDVDLLNLIARRTGLKFVIVPYKSWEDLLGNWSHLDMTCSTSKSNVREQAMDFTQEYSTSPLVIVEREGEGVYGPPAVLANMRLALPRRHITTQVIIKRLPASARVIFAATQEECFRLIADKQADATVANLFVASQFLNAHPKIKLDICGVIAQSDQPMRMAVRRELDHGIPVAILDQGLSSISQEEMDNIVSKHLLFGLESRQRVGFVQTRTKQVLLVSAFAAVVLILWNYFMRKEIRARRNAEAELREANESMKIFSHSLSHDLRAPLRGITGLAEALKEDHYEKLDTEGQNYLDRIITSGSRMDKLIADVLAYNRTANSDWPMETVELDPLVHNLVEEFPPAQRHFLQIVSRLPAVRGHPTLLTQCLSNLFSNAIRFVPPEREPHITISATRENSYVTIFVEDNGIGVKSQDRHRIFQIFERAAPASFAGTGVGLAVVAKAAERMGGSVGVEPAAEQGSRFWIRLSAAGVQKAVEQSTGSHPFWHRVLHLKGT